MDKLKNPNPDQVKEIFNDVYNGLFRKFKDANTDKELQEFVKEVHLISKKHPFELCHVMLVEVSCIIHQYYKEKHYEKAN